MKTTSSEATVAGCTSSKKSSVSSNDVEGIINDLTTEDQKKVSHHSRCCREKKCSGLRTDEKQRLSNKKDRFQHEWLFEANVSYEKTGLRWLVFVEGEGMYIGTLTDATSTNELQNIREEYEEAISLLNLGDMVEEKLDALEAFAKSVESDDSDDSGVDE